MGVGSFPGFFACFAIYCNHQGLPAHGDDRRILVDKGALPGIPERHFSLVFPAEVETPDKRPADAFAAHHLAAGPYRQYIIL